MRNYRHDLVDTDNPVVNHPSHYTAGSIEVIDMIESAGWARNFCAGNAIKYIMRHEHKGTPIQDLEKALWYINKLITLLQKEEEENKEVNIDRAIN